MPFRSGPAPVSFSLLVLNGPNLNLLGTRQPEVYGRQTLDDIAEMCRATADELGVELDFRQSNHEGELITWIQQARNLNDGLILNPAALTHTSVGLLDALLAAELPTIEVHLSNLHQREDFRRHSFTAQAALGVIAGLGAEGYRLALIALTRHLAGQIADTT
ncbi:3-dehydroquinate dehydratase [Roseospirillum parvum]|uniref:3-dehydroquinate dehydratase n=1 Tax=Roseospirillum parvum TaxID=83401 RepID=A0A1G7UKQ7_9PROT|nr:3-dehydroquinate dehydratase [Roseospirillum parvum]